jgi:hypothetical protein
VTVEPEHRLPVPGAQPAPAELRVIHIQGESRAPPPPAPAPPYSPPVSGALAAAFGLAALFGHATLILAPLAILISVVALLRRHFAWAALGTVTAVVALVTSPVFWLLLGLGWLTAWLARYLI